MNDTWLRDGLRSLADEYGASRTDLYTEAIRRSRRSTVRRAVVGCVALVLAITGGTVFALRPDVAAAPVPPAVTPVIPAPTTAPPRPDLSRAGDTVDVPPDAADLRDATVTLPSLGYGVPWCGGTIRFAGYLGGSGPVQVQITREWAGDLTGDGVPETLAMVVCELGGLRTWQVVAFTGASAMAPGTPVLLGQVVAIGARPAPAALFDLSVTADGAVVTEVGDYLGSSGPEAARISTHQQRVYRWNPGGSHQAAGFHQVAGPVSFPANPYFYTLQVPAVTLAFGPAQGGTRTGRLTVSVSNKGPGATRNVRIILGYPVFAEPVADPAWQRCDRNATAGGVTGTTCVIDLIEAGASATLSLPFAAPARRGPADLAPLAGQLVVAVYGSDSLGYGYSLEQDPHLVPITITFG